MVQSLLELDEDTVISMTTVRHQQKVEERRDSGRKDLLAC